MVSRVCMDAIWRDWSEGSDLGGRSTKEKWLLGENAGRVRGIVLDVGAGKWIGSIVWVVRLTRFFPGIGHGSLVYYLDRSRVTTYAALEPNPFMHEHIRKAANKEGFEEEDGSLLIIPYGIEQVEKIQQLLKSHRLKFHDKLSASNQDALTHLANGQVTAAIAVLSFCSIPNPQQTITSLVSEILAPGGTLFFYEHVMNPNPSIARLQRILGKIWIIFFDGCVLGQDTVRMVREAGEKCGGWESISLLQKEEEDPGSLFVHAAGTCVKKSE